jgi:hypothetical protein
MLSLSSPGPAAKPLLLLLLLSRPVPKPVAASAFTVVPRGALLLVLV